jgi:uncharacterized membrane protein
LEQLTIILIGLRVFLLTNQKRKKRKNVKNVIVIVIAKKLCILIGTMAICVLVRGANINFMRYLHGIFINKTRKFLQKVIWFSMAMANKINSKLGEKKCTKA